MPLYLNTYNIYETQKTKEAQKKEPKKSKINAQAVEEFEMENDSTAK